MDGPGIIATVEGRRALKSLRTPDDRFTHLPGFPYAPHYVQVEGTNLDGGLRMHYVDEGGGDELFLCLHGEPSWSYL